MADYTRGEVAGGWIYIMRGKSPVALVHPRHIDEFLATPDIYKALLAVYGDIELQNVKGGSEELNLQVQQALEKAEGD